MIEEWKTEVLGDIIAVKGGKRLPKGEKLSDLPTNHPYIRVTDFENYTVNTSDLKYLEPRIQIRIKNYIIKKEDVFISIAGTIGFVGKIPDELDGANLTENAARLIIKEKKLLDRDFLVFVLSAHHNRQDLLSRMSKNAQPKLSLSNIKSFQILVPPLPEQRKIAYVLSTVQKAIEQQDKLIRTTTELKKALMQKLFTEGTKGEKQKQTEIGLVPESWEVKTLNEYIQPTRLKDPTKTPSSKFIYVDVSSVSNEFYKITEPNEILGKDAPSRARKLIQTDDVIFATVRPTLRRIAKITDDYNNQVCSTGYCVLKPHSGQLDSEYLFQYLQIDSFIERIEKLQRGASYPAVRDSDVKGMKFPIPKYDEQVIIGNILNTIDKKINREHEKKQTLIDLFNTLLHELMTGQRRVNEIDFEQSAKKYQIKGQQLGMVAEN